MGLPAGDQNGTPNGTPHSAVLRLRGLPFAASDEEIRSFLSEFEIVDTHICKRNGKSTGEAFVEFSTVDDARRALLSHHTKHFTADPNSRYIEIFDALDAELVDRLSGPPGETRCTLKGHVVRLRGLPFGATHAEVCKFFDGLEVLGGSDGIFFTTMPDGRPTGEAYCEFPSAEVQQLALALHKNKIGSRYVELFAATKGDLFQALQQNGYYTYTDGKRRYNSPRGAHSAGYNDAATVRLRGIPADATVEDVTTLFAGFGVTDGNVQLVTKNEPSGEQVNTGVALVKFSSTEDADRATKEQHLAIHGCPVEVSLPRSVHSAPQFLGPSQGHHARFPGVRPPPPGARHGPMAPVGMPRPEFMPQFFPPPPQGGMRGGPPVPVRGGTSPHMVPMLHDYQQHMMQQQFMMQQHHALHAQHAQHAAAMHASYDAHRSPQQAHHGQWPGVPRPPPPPQHPGSVWFHRGHGPPVLEGMGPIGAPALPPLGQIGSHAMPGPRLPAQNGHRAGPPPHRLPLVVLPDSQPPPAPAPVRAPVPPAPSGGPTPVKLPHSALTAALGTTAGGNGPK